ncbi:hypothetical protein [Okeania sp. KiyG1]|uniref:hypothetical protein n=1 Tax=Okeania sp. KiyG1 TaxID=2720165 RepID=UPI001923D150|nr:hypothetical protein [Okeania sp. KiyG1]GGA06179.1 hypothetical protein CYANOKiyG1_18630 [Okeania sp. KiyG1]
MWPTCINKLSPFKGNFSEEIPELLKVAFNEKGIFNEDEMFMPVRIVNILGRCSTAMYLDCPNIPEHHLYHAEGYENDPDYDTGRYYWFDFDIVGMDELLLPLRIVINIGDADCNDGFWGVVWERNTEEIIANIISSGDMETTIEAISKQHINMYEYQKILIPTIFDKTDSISDEIIIANNTKIEKILRFVTKFCIELIYYNQEKNWIESIHYEEEEERSGLIAIDYELIDDDDEVED